MKILIASTPASGHLNPLLSVGQAAQSHGHEVVALCAHALRDVIVLFAVLLTLLAVFAWVQWLRDLTNRDGTPLRAPGRGTCRR